MIRIVFHGLEAEETAEPFIGQLEQLLSEQHPDISGVVSVKIVDSDEVRRLQAEYGGQEASTDVLSFSYREDAEQMEGANEELGDVVISQEHMRRQAAAAETAVEAEGVLLLIHGVLHILGYDHGDQASLTDMDRMQSSLMDRLDLPYRDFGWRK